MGANGGRSLSTHRASHLPARITRWFERARTPPPSPSGRLRRQWSRYRRRHKPAGIGQRFVGVPRAAQL